jgi:hypothetical protein
MSFAEQVHAESSLVAIVVAHGSARSQPDNNNPFTTIEKEN